MSPSKFSWFFLQQLLLSTLFVSIIQLSRTAHAAVYSTESRTGRIPSLTEILGADVAQRGFPISHVKHHQQRFRGRQVLDSTFPQADHDIVVGNVIQPSVAYDEGYFVKMQLGTPVQDVLLLIDTGSNVIWTQCASCNPCVPTPPDVNFDPTHSETFTSTNRTISISYGDGTVTAGNFSIDTLTIDSGYGERDVFQDFEFLCATNSSSPNVANVGSGIVGLDLQSSFLGQLKDRNQSIVFRYCFPDEEKSPNATSFLSIGDIEKPYIPETDTEMLYTPLRLDLYQDYSIEFVALNLTGISVAGQRLNIDISVLNSPVFVKPGETDPSYNITIIDSGSTITSLPVSVLSTIEGSFRNATSSDIKSVVLDLHDGCAPHLCFEVTVDREFAASFPSVSYIFPKHGGRKGDEIEVVLPGDGLLHRYDNETVCLQICGQQDGVINGRNTNIIGNRDQRNYLIEYDYEKRRIGFQRASCAFEE